VDCRCQVVGEIGLIGVEAEDAVKVQAGSEMGEEGDERWGDAVGRKGEW